MLRYLLAISMTLQALRFGVSAAPRREGLADDTTGSKPIAASWMYLSDDQKYDTIPSAWNSINFKVVDYLYVGPLGVQEDGTFGLYNSSATGPLAHRLKWTIKTAREQNPDIKIIVSQWWGSGAHSWGEALSALKNDENVDKYTTSVKTFMQHWKDVNGYDIDYESNNVVDRVPMVLSQIRNKLQSIEGRKFVVSVSPSVTTNLDKAKASLDYVNLQTYAGGISLTPQQFVDLGFKAEQLLYGICAESGCQSPSLVEVKKAYTKGHLAGIHMYRLNSGNYEEEGQVQEKVYRFLHGGS